MEHCVVTALIGTAISQQLPVWRYLNKYNKTMHIISRYSK